mgnify:CR=1 FL=1
MSTNEEFIPQGEISTEPEVRNTPVLSTENSITDAGGGITAKGDITKNTYQEQLEKEAVKTEEVKETPVQKDLFSLLKEQQESEKVVQEKAVQEIQPQIANNQSWETEKMAFLSKIEQLEQQLTFQKSLEQNPLETLSKFVPGVVLNKESPYFFDAEEYVKAKATEKYGADFYYNPSEAYQVGTNSYRYRTDIQNWESEALRAKQEALSSVSRVEEQERQQFETTKQSIISKYGIDEVTFDSKIMNRLSQMTDANRMEMLADAIMIIEGNNLTKNNINNNSNSVRRIPPSPLDVQKNNTPIPVNQMDQELEAMFGRPYGVGTSY